jgi:hypothetical protein
MNVIVRVVSSDSTRLTRAIKPAAESTTVEMELDVEVTVKLAVAFETTDVDMYSADAEQEVQHRRHVDIADAYPGMP